MRKKRVLFLGGNFYPEFTGIGKYNGEMIKWLAGKGHDCTVITTFPYYPQWKVQKRYKTRCFWFKKERINLKHDYPIRVIRCPHYIPKNPSGIHRIISQFSFFFSACLVILVLLVRRKFDYIITVAPPFEIGLLGILYKMIRGGELVYHIQDLQIDAARDLGMIKQSKVITVFLYVEKFIFKHADYISTISKGMIKKIKNKSNKEVLFFPNWVDVKKFYPLNNKEAVKAKYGFSATDKVILYSGAIGHKQGLEVILHSAKKLENLSYLKFAICGSGPYKERLEKLKEELELQNAFFFPLQPLTQFNSFINIADIHLILLKKGSDDLFLPSKLSTILSIGGVSIVTASAGTSLHEILSSENMGILIEPENQMELIDAILNIEKNNPNEMSKNARRYAEKRLSGNKILNEYFARIFATKEKNKTNYTNKNDLISCSEIK